MRRIVDMDSWSVITYCSGIRLSSPPKRFKWR